MRAAACVPFMVCLLAPAPGLARPAGGPDAPSTDAKRSAVDEYLRDLRSSLPSVRRNAVFSTGRLRDRSRVSARVDALVEALGDRDGGVRREAAKALGLMKPGPPDDGRAAAALARALGDRDPNVRLYAAYALGEIRDPKTAGALVRALGDPAYGVRDQAAWALVELSKLGEHGERRDPELARPLAAALGREDADVPHVTWILGQLGGERAVSAVGALLDDADPEVRLRAVRALEGFADGGPVDRPVNRLVAVLVRALRDDEAAVRLRAARALLGTGDERALEALRKLAAGEDDPAVREAAEQAVLRMSRHGNLAAHWSFDETDRIRATGLAKDATGRGADGEVHGCRPVKGKFGRALAFGGDAYVELGRPAGLPIAGRAFTVSAWVRPTGRNGVVVARGGAFCGFSLYVKDGLPKFGIHRLQDGPTYIAAGREDVVGSWAHLAGVVAKDRIELYVNGSLAASARTPGYLPSDCGQGMEIGFDVANSPAEITDHFEGVIDEVKFYDAALSQEQIAKEARAAD